MKLLSDEDEKVRSIAAKHKSMGAEHLEKLYKAMNKYKMEPVIKSFLRARPKLEAEIMLRFSQSTRTEVLLAIINHPNVDPSLLLTLKTHKNHDVSQRAARVIDSNKKKGKTPQSQPQASTADGGHSTKKIIIIVVVVGLLIFMAAVVTLLFVWTSLSL